MPSDPQHQSTDPLHAYRGPDRALRDEIERILMRHCVPYAALVPAGGTMHLANLIMEAIKRHGR